MGNDAIDEIILEGLRRALMEATGNLYRVFTSPDREADHEEKFMRGVEKHVADYERMTALVTKRERK